MDIVKPVKRSTGAKKIIVMKTQKVSKKKANEMTVKVTRKENQTKKVRIEEVVQAKPHHLHEPDDAKFIEKKQYDIIKLHQVLPIIPEDKELNELNRDKSSSKIVKTPAVDTPHLSLHTGKVEPEGPKKLGCKKTFYDDCISNASMNMTQL